MSTVQFVVRLLKLLFVCVLDCLGYVAQLLCVTGIHFEMLVPGVTLLVLFGRGLTNVIGGCFPFFCLYSAH